ncbi:hypothetical protein MNBD_CPR01-203 [hydrothermal vent metagenome]|uniref:Uncharacterized protein n=1 Tax=hydrothermal vent metagenome TaxID=652676 RepID=A0A3B0UUI7_9ZZZZ
MKKKMSVLLAIVAVSFVFAFTASAQTVISSATSNSKSKAIGAITNPTAIAGNKTSVNGVSGNVKVGLRQNFAGSNIPGNFPSMQVPMGRVPEVFTTPGVPPVVSGLQLMEWYKVVCRPMATREHRLSEMSFKGESGDTSIIFVPHQDYFDGGATVVKTRAESTSPKFFNIEGDDAPVQRVSTSGALVNSVSSLYRAGMYVPLGVVTIEVTKKEGGVPISVIQSDLRAFIFDHLSGFGIVDTLTNPHAIGAMAAMSNSGAGFSLMGQGLSYALDRASGGLLGGGFSGGYGSTGANAKLGSTYVLLAPSKDGNGIFIDPNTLSRAYSKK